MDSKQQAQELMLKVTEILQKRYPIHDVPFGAKEIVALLADALAAEAERVRREFAEEICKLVSDWYGHGPDEQGGIESEIRALADQPRQGVKG